MTKADDDRARIEELRRQACIAQGRAPDVPTNVVNVPARRWTSGAGEVQWARVGPNVQVLTLEEAARRLKITVRELLASVKLTELGGWGGFVALSEVERLEAEWATHS